MHVPYTRNCWTDSNFNNNAQEQCGVVVEIYVSTRVDPIWSILIEYISIVQKIPPPFKSCPRKNTVIDETPFPVAKIVVSALEKKGVVKTEGKICRHQFLIHCVLLYIQQHNYTYNDVACYIYCCIQEFKVDWRFLAAAAVDLMARKKHYGMHYLQPDAEKQGSIKIFTDSGKRENVTLNNNQWTFRSMCDYVWNMAISWTLTFVLLLGKWFKTIVTHCSY